jgi:hypothetical protein
VYLVLWTLAAAQVLDRIEADPTLMHVLRAVRRTLGRLESDPFDPRLRTRQFATERYGQVRSTPVGVSDWRVLWFIGPEPDQIVIAFIAETSL